MPSLSQGRQLLALASVLLVGCATHVPPPGLLASSRRAPPVLAQAWPSESNPVQDSGDGLSTAPGDARTTHPRDAERRAQAVEEARVQALVRAARQEGGGSEEAEAAAREAEAGRARAAVLGMALGVEEPGARLTFTWWAHEGALTPLGYREERGTGSTGRPVDGEGLDRMLRLVFSEYVGQRTGEVVLTLTREETRWAVDYDAPHASARPPEAKTLPVQARGTPAHTFLAFHEAAKDCLRTVQVPHGGAVQMDMRVHLEDGRLARWELLRSWRTREGSGGPSRPLSHTLVGAVTRVLLPFTEGLGPRSVHVVLQAEHRQAEAEARGQVALARVERPLPAPELSWYRAMHEATLLRWREDVHEGTAWLARRGVEELALWYAGGIAAQGASFFALKGLTVVTRALGRTPEAAAGWLRTTLSRLSGEQRKSFEQLWRKVQLEGEQSLTHGERKALRGLMEDIEALARKPLAPGEKDILRGKAREYYKKLHPELASLMDKNSQAYPVHHRRPLEHAHLFSDEDINAAANLVMMRDVVHKRINTVWTRLRKNRVALTAQEVEQVVDIIDKHFEARWYNRASFPESDLPLIDKALEATVAELRQRFPGIH
jgi:hypothetical protein